MGADDEENEIMTKLSKISWKAWGVGCFFCSHNPAYGFGDPCRMDTPPNLVCRNGHGREHLHKTELLFVANPVLEAKFEILR